MKKPEEDRDKNAAVAADSGQVILVVEDEPALSDIFATALKADGFLVEQAFDGVEGLDKALHRSPVAIVLDLLLPIKDGFEVLQDLKANGKTAAIPVIILSNLGQDFEVRRGLELGAQCFFTKTDLEPRQLPPVVRSILAGRGCHPHLPGTAD